MKEGERERVREREREKRETRDLEGGRERERQTETETQRETETEREEKAKKRANVSVILRYGDVSTRKWLTADPTDAAVQMTLTVMTQERESVITVLMMKKSFLTTTG